MLLLLALHAVVAAAIPALARRLGGTVWLLAAVVPLAAACWVLAQAPRVLGAGPITESLDWVPTLGLRLELRLDALSLLMAVVVSVVGALVLLYARHYVESETGRTAALLLAFAGAMFGLVTSDNLILLYVFWELTTVASFLLIAGRGGAGERGPAAVQALLTTVAGGLAMLLGLVMLGEAAGTYRVSDILAAPPSGGLVPSALVLVLVGAFTKSAQVPLHSWLPAAMVAPTPVSAYLHAAAMVKAGVYLVARLAPGFADAHVWRPAVVVVGLASLLAGAWWALWATDLKKLLAYGTISELGLLILLFGVGTRTGALAGAAMLVAHAAFKATLFLVVGILDERAGGRDLRELSGVARRLPRLFAVAALAAASMAGIAPLLGFIGKEAAYEAFLHGGTADWITLAGLVAGSVLTVGYAARFLWGAFADKPGVPATEVGRPAVGFVAPAAVLALTGLALGVGYPLVAAPADAYAGALPAHADYELALWHGFTPTLGLSVLTVGLGLLVHFGHKSLTRPHRLLATPADADAGYRSALRGLDRCAVWLTRHTQVGSLPAYLGVLLLTVLLVPGAALVTSGITTGFTAPRLPPGEWVQLPLAVIVLVAAGAAVVTRGRLAAVVLVGAAGYGVAGLFVVHGAPDLALTQFLVESLVLVVMVLVLRRLPEKSAVDAERWRLRSPRLVLAGMVGLFVAAFALSARAARREPPISGEHLRRAEETGAHNVVTAIIVDFRALDTLGEVSVLLVTAVGVASLVVLERRAATPGETGSSAEQVADDAKEVRP